MKTGRHPIIKALAVMLGFLLLNISVNSNFIISGKVKPNANNIESLFELIVETGLGFENAMSESNNDDSPLNEEIKVIDYVIPQTGKLSSSNSLSLNQYATHRCVKYSVIFEIAPPPPKA